MPRVTITKKQWERLSKFDRLLVLLFTIRKYWINRYIIRRPAIPPITKFIGLHSIILMIVIGFYPPAWELPAAIIPLTWFGSLSAALILYVLASSMLFKR